MMPRMIAKAISSAKNVALGTRKLPSAMIIWSGMARSSPARENEDEQRHEGEVDEVHRLDQADRQEEDREQPALGLRLARHTRDGRAAGETVADRRADRAAAEREATADERAGELDRLLRCVSHFSPQFSDMSLWAGQGQVGGVSGPVLRVTGGPGAGVSVRLPPTEQPSRSTALSAGRR